MEMIYRLLIWKKW